MRFVIKLLITMAIIIFCSQIGRKMPTLAGLIATAPITSLIVLLWLYSDRRSEEHTSELQSHSFISYAVFCLKKKKKQKTQQVKLPKW